MVWNRGGGEVEEGVWGGGLLAGGGLSSCAGGGSDAPVSEQVSVVSDMVGGLD
eukprot:COSAG02_NODE_60590_length_271_cov_0.552326_1_plen_52_part_01